MPARARAGIEPKDDFYVALSSDNGLFGPYTKNTTLRSIPPGLKRLVTNLAMLVKEVAAFDLIQRARVLCNAGP